MSPHEHPSLHVNQSLHRLPLILDILDEIEDGTSNPGDDELRHGSHQAVWRMVERLQGIEPSHVAKDAAPEHELEIAGTWLLGDRPRNLLPASLYEELSQLIEKLIPTSTGMMSEQAE